MQITFAEKRKQKCKKKKKEEEEEGEEEEEKYSFTNNNVNKTDLLKKRKRRTRYIEMDIFLAFAEKVDGLKIQLSIIFSLNIKCRQFFLKKTIQNNDPYPGQGLI